MSETWDGKYHRIKISVRKPGYEVRAQAGYFDPKPFADYTEVEKQIHLVDVALAESPMSQRPVRFGLAAQACSPDAEDNLVLAAAIPLEALGDIAKDRVEIIRIVFNAGDEIVDLRRTEEDLRGVKAASAYLVSSMSAPRGRTVAGSLSGTS